ncbi:MAG: tetratricopeptide repeat protein, partial [Syntrophobacteria bacterium]
MRRARQIAGQIGLYMVPLLLAGCALLPAKREVTPKVPPEAAAQLFSRAEEALEEGELEQASQRYREVLTSFPQSPEAPRALVRLGEIEFGLKRYADAAARFQDAVQRFPLSSESDAARLWLLRCYLKLERFNDAVEAGRSLVGHLPEKTQRAEAAEIVGDAQRGLGRYAEAVRWYGTAHELAEEEKRSLLAEKVNTAVDNLDREVLLSLLSQYPEDFPNLQLQTRLAEIEMQSGQPAMAQKRLQTLMEKQPAAPLAETWKAMAEKAQQLLAVDMTAVGCLLPLSGRYQHYGDRVLRGLLVALQDSKALAEGLR